jgi:hypothetical protein
LDDVDEKHTVPGPTPAMIASALDVIMVFGQLKLKSGES